MRRSKRIIQRSTNNSGTQSKKTASLADAAWVAKSLRFWFRKILLYGCQCVALCVRDFRSNYYCNSTKGTTSSEAPYWNSSKRLQTGNVADEVEALYSIRRTMTPPTNFRYLAAEACSVSKTTGEKTEHLSMKDPGVCEFTLSV